MISVLGFLMICAQLLANAKAAWESCDQRGDQSCGADSFCEPGLLVCLPCRDRCQEIYRYKSCQHFCERLAGSVNKEKPIKKSNVNPVHNKLPDNGTGGGYDFDKNADGTRQISGNGTKESAEGKTGFLDPRNHTENSTFKKSNCRGDAKNSTSFTMMQSEAPVLGKALVACISSLVLTSLVLILMLVYLCCRLRKANRARCMCRCQEQDEMLKLHRNTTATCACKLPTEPPEPLLPSSDASTSYPQQMSAHGHEEQPV